MGIMIRGDQGRVGGRREVDESWLGFGFVLVFFGFTTFSACLIDDFRLSSFSFWPATLLREGAEKE